MEPTPREWLATREQTAPRRWFRLLARLLPALAVPLLLAAAPVERDPPTPVETDAADPASKGVAVTVQELVTEDCRAGWNLLCRFENTGTVDLSRVDFRIAFLGADGEVVAERDAALVPSPADAVLLQSPLPEPFRPGEQVWFQHYLEPHLAPEGWTGNGADLRVVVTKLTPAS